MIQRGRPACDFIRGWLHYCLEAYARLQEIDDELKATYDEWFEAEGEHKEELEEQREKLKAEYDFLEAAYGLEAPDKNW